MNNPIQNRCGWLRRAALASVMLGACVSVQAQTETGLDVMTRVDAQPSPPVMSSEMTMTLIDRNGQQRVRSLTSTRKTFADSERSLIFFLAPQDVRGTGFLTIDYDDTHRDDDQWLYLPSLNKSKRIAGGDQSGRFMGSDLSYADLSSRNLADWNYTLVREDTVDDAPVWVVEAVAASDAVVEQTGYTESILYVRQSNHQVIRAVHTLEAVGERKLMNLPEWETIDGYWIPLVIQVATQEGGHTVHRTQLTFRNIELDVDVPDSVFTVHRLEQGL